jgi:oligo-alginate lyase
MHSVVHAQLRRAVLLAAATGLVLAAPARSGAQSGVRPAGPPATLRVDRAPHPSIFLTAAEAKAVRAATAPALKAALLRARIVMDSAFAAPMDVPPPGEAGGYAHERHKRNYREMQTAGMLWQITGDARYARFVRDLLERYAVLYPTLGAHPLAKGQAPGKLFHQSLNEANWLVATAIAYDCVYDWLSAAERARFESTIFRPMAEWLSVSQAKEFDRIHNHGTWAVASVGLIGYVMRDTSYVNRALYGTTRNRTGGFLRQMDLLFSPDGYYMEGPYYTRYALMPFFQFAEAIERAQPSLKIYAYRDSILKKAVRSMMQTAFPNGAFPPINDASRSMSIEAPEVVLALDIAYARYGADSNLLGAAAMQRDVLLTGAGLAVARDLAARATPPAMSFGSVEFTDGPDGTGGGLGILRSGSGRDATMLLMKYGLHGEGHGHFDKLHFSLFDGGREVVPDYGFARWINIEPKFGGRYLPENTSYAMSTVAHNTVVVDERAQSGGKHDTADEVTGARHFFDAHDASVQVMSARDTVSYGGVRQQRTMLLVRDARLPYPVVIDLFSAASAAPHVYDYPLHFRGPLIASSVPYRAATTQQDALGTGGGYQHLWKEASGTTDGLVKLTWLDGSRYYTALTASAPGSEVIFARTGAGDPNFNLMSEPLMLVRRRAAAVQFASVIEPHGFFSELQEKSMEATGRLTSVRIVGADATDGGGTVVEVEGAGGIVWTVMITQGPASATARHRVTAAGRTFEWTGNYSVTGVQRAR